MVTRCLENSVYAVTANRIGNEAQGGDKFTFTGGSQITSFDGSILSSAPKDSSFIDFVDADLTLADNKMITPFNDLLGDRHPDIYKKIIQTANENLN